MRSQIPQRPARARLTPEGRLKAAREQFIAMWGQMASSWGVPRSMAEVHALLFVEGRPMNTDELIARLGISRGNASMTVRTLVDWGIVARAHNRVDRKDYFTAEQDVWTLLATVIRARKRRELEPLLALLSGCRTTASACEEETEEPASAETRAALAQLCGKFGALLELIQTLDSLSEHFLAAGSGGMGSAIETIAMETRAGAQPTKEQSS